MRILGLGVLLPLVGLILSATEGAARTWYVKPDGTGDLPTIQVALTAASSGDVVLLAGGTFSGAGNRNLDFGGKAITLTSELSPSGTTIRCDGDMFFYHRGFFFHSGEGPGSVVEGVCIYRGQATGDVPGGRYGGAVYCFGASPSFRNCVFLENGASLRGGAVACFAGAAPTFEDCTFTSNLASDAGALYCDASSVIAAGCRFLDNLGLSTGGAVLLKGSTGYFGSCIFLRNWCTWYGGGLSSSFSSSATVEHCTFAENSGAEEGGMGGGLAVYSNSTLAVTNTIVAFSRSGEAVGGNATLTCCDLYGNLGGDWVGEIAGQYGVNGNISADPLFCDLATDDVRLHPDSPCVVPQLEPGCDGFIGALEAGCGPTSVTGPLEVRSTWGGVKGLYR